MMDSGYRDARAGGPWSRQRSALRGALDAAAALGRNVHYLGGRTQNPHVMARYADWGILFPLDETYDTERGRALMSFLLEHIREVGVPARRGNLDRGTGLIKRVYGEGRLGDYAVPDTPRVVKWESWLARNGFERESGDAVAMVAVHQPGSRAIPKHPAA